jgi:hypothetical protein
MLFAVSLVCGSAASARGVAADQGTSAAVMHGHAVAVEQGCADCAAPDVSAHMACAAMAAHCAPAIASVDVAGQVIARLAMQADRIAPVDLVLIGSGPESDPPPPRL